MGNKIKVNLKAIEKYRSEVLKHFWDAYVEGCIARVEISAIACQYAISSEWHPALVAGLIWGWSASDIEMIDESTLRIHVYDECEGLQPERYEDTAAFIKETPEGKYLVVRSDTLEFINSIDWSHEEAMYFDSHEEAESYVMDCRHGVDLLPGPLNPEIIPADFMQLGWKAPRLDPND